MRARPLAVLVSALVLLPAAGAPAAEVWREPGMGHAEVATTPDLLDRIGGWVRAAHECAAHVCDDERRDR